MNWYEQHGYIENPFATGSGVFIEKSINLSEPLEEIAYNVEAGNMVLVEGERGTGKSTLLRSITEKFRGERKVVYFDCSKEEVDIKKLMQGKHGLIGRIFNITPKGMILLLDNFTKLSKKDIEMAKYYYDNNYIRAIVFAGNVAELPENVHDRIGNRIIRLRQLNVKDSVELVKNRLGTLDFLSETVIKKIYKKSGRNTVAFLEACDEACKEATKDGSETVKEAHLAAKSDIK